MAEKSSCTTRLRLPSTRTGVPVPASGPMRAGRRSRARGATPPARYFATKLGSHACCRQPRGSVGQFASVYLSAQLGVGASEVPLCSEAAD